MRNTNVCFIHGRIGKDPEVRFLPSGTPQAKFSLCSNDDYFDRKANSWVEVAEWHDCVVVGDYAEKVAEKYQKGDLVNITCRVKPRTYVGRDQQRCKVVEMYVQSIELIAKKGELVRQQSNGQAGSRGPGQHQGSTEQFRDEGQGYAGGYGDDDRGPAF
ncbi:single-stranded DNA-binding protein [Paraburkholderia humisilvae]|uniref:Single-stranded DNA-binding protein n=1 Tax=Paraburkholderia humisilvae TaxID=627669 RepID=A0A6J5ER44_9BURK|nr:single-stranded DNA-binding protein [Paraburkholderia humisilvae]CAB3767475.1 Single-stranded DNA-binding protein [Paraburkholderia humisilvae]